ncbi:SAM-dependent methyltransferase [Streptomyces sp. NPDC091377]|uniref:SAM-dependent methyltransferase n=1 Tax=Streptomyces sp. NPDC091377 TaxID=3365995 RepID=UPI0038146702
MSESRAPVRRTDDTSKSRTPVREAAPVRPVAHSARVWNYWCGGRDNYEVDERVGDEVAALFPVIRDVARANRAFLGRAVRFLAGECGVRQFLDLGTGLPTGDNTHEVAQRVAPDARIVYVDNDPTVLMYARALLTGTDAGATDYLDADVREPDALVERAAETLDLGRPVAVLMLGVLNFVQDTEEARSIVRRVMAALPSGSHLALSHPTADLALGGEGQISAMAYWNEHARPPIRARDRAATASLFEGLELLEPGLVSCSAWRPLSQAPAVVPQFGAVAVKP